MGATTEAVEVEGEKLMQFVFRAGPAARRGEGGRGVARGVRCDP
jgi:hypothetical protein